jgi:hypothetical protein
MTDPVYWQWRRSAILAWPDEVLNYEPAVTAPGTEKRALFAGPAIPFVEGKS